MSDSLVHNPQELLPGPDDLGLRLDQFLARRQPECSRSQLQKWIRDGQVQLNGRVLTVPSQRVAPGDRLRIAASAAAPLVGGAVRLVPTAMELRVLFEDEHVIGIDKPAGVTVHPGAGTLPGTTLVEGVMHHCGELPGQIGDGSTLADERPGVVHRIDRDTSGVLVLAKTPLAQASLSRQFQGKTVERLYLAVLGGSLRNLPVGGVIEVSSYLERDPSSRTRFRSVPGTFAAKQDCPSRGRWAMSIFRVKKALPGGRTLAEVILRTGRTHQIRIHSRDLGSPVWGDGVYGSTARAGGPRPERQLLHAATLGFDHPVTGERVRLFAPMPEDFAKWLGSIDSL